MSISIFDYRVYLQDDLKLNREYLKLNSAMKMNSIIRQMGRH